ncbi:HAD family hydrolase [archaeon]|nr:HAD family hydrolase [archaeon]
MIKVLSFDVDGTLVDGRFADMFWNDGVPKLYAEKVGLSFDEAKDYLQGRYDEIGDCDLRWYLPEYWFAELGIDKNPKELVMEYACEIDVFPEVPEVLRKLSEKYMLVASSNAPRIFLEESIKGLCEYFKHTFSSTTDFGLVKKLPEFYHTLFEVLHIEPSELVHVGDHFEFDYNVPSQAGVKSFFLDRKNKGNRGHVLRDLSELEGRL